MIFSILVGSMLLAVVLSAEGGGMPTSITGNIGMYGSGYGDVYAGKIKEGVYGAGGRFGGNIGLTGSAGWGRKRREVGMKASGKGATSLTGAGSGNMFSMAGSSAGGGQLSISGFPGRRTRESEMNTIQDKDTSLREAGSGNQLSMDGSSAGSIQLSTGEFPVGVAPSSPEEENLSRKRRGSGAKVKGDGPTSMAGAGNGDMFSFAAASAGKGHINFGGFQPPAPAEDEAKEDEEEEEEEEEVTTKKPRRKHKRRKNKCRGDRKKRQAVVLSVGTPTGPRPVISVRPYSGPRPVMTTVAPPDLVPQNNTTKPDETVFIPSIGFKFLPGVSGAYARSSFSFVGNATVTDEGEVIITGARVVNEI